MRLLALSGLLALGGVAFVAPACHTLLDIDHIEFADGPVGGAGGAAAGGAGGTAGAGGSCGEDCRNGVDDDGNEQTDCEDPCCAAWRCVPAAPEFWSGPVARYLGSDQALACPGSWPAMVIDGGEGTIAAEPASCEPCTCSSPQGASCTVSVSFWDDLACSGPADGTASPAAGACVAVPGAALQHNDALAGPEGASGGTCSSGGGSPTHGPALFDPRLLLCEGATTGGGCGVGGEVCAPLPADPFATTICIFRDGDWPCDEHAPYTEPLTAYATLDDARVCSACTCSPPTGGSCTGGSIDLFEPETNTACGQPAARVLAPSGSCDSTLMWPGSMIYHPGTPTGGGCAATGGEPSGEATATALVTLCCLAAQ